MENKQSYFSEVWCGVKSLVTGLRVTLKEYFTPKSTEQYPENRKTTLHVAQRHRGRLVFKRNEDGTHTVFKVVGKLNGVEVTRINTELAEHTIT